MENVRKISKKYYLRQVMACWLVFWMALGLPVQMARGVTPGDVVNVPTGPGSIDFTGSVLGHTKVNVFKNKVIINWDTFDTPTGESISFLRGTNFAALNRVVNGGATNFDGTLFAPNGNIFLINSRGVMFGPSASIQTRFFVASGLGMRNADFMNGTGPMGPPDNINYQFGYGNRLGNPGTDMIGDVTLLQHSTIGQATIEAQKIALIGRNIINKGVIRTTSPDGVVVMAAGHKAYIGKDGGNVYVQVDIPGSPSHHVVDNGGFTVPDPAVGTVDAPDAQVVLAAGDIYSTALEGIESLRAVAHRNIHLNGAVTATDEVLVNSSHTGTGGSIYVNDNIEAGEIKLKAGNPTAYEASMARVQVADGKTLTSTDGHIWIEGVHDIILGGAVDAATDLRINGDKQGSGGHGFGGDLWAKDDLTAGGNIGILGNDLNFDGDVRANGGNLRITGRTSEDGATGWGDIDVASGGTLLATGDLDIIDYSDPGGEPAMDLRGHDSLSIIAGGTIDSEAVIYVMGSSLLMQQGPSINTASYMFSNQANTDLTLISTGGSVTSDQTVVFNAANRWKSIGAHANQNITLVRSNGKNEITLGNSGTAGKSLWAENGYINIDGFNVENSVDFADWNLEAGTTLSIDVVHGIDLGGDVTTHSGDMELLADTDTRYGWDVVVAGNINSGGELNIEGTNVDIQSAQSAGDMDIYAHGLYDDDPMGSEPLIASGDVRVHGTLDTTDGHIVIEARDDFGSGGATTGPKFESPGDTSYSASGTIYLHNNVTANGGSGDDVVLMSNTVASDNVKIESTGDDVVLAEGKTMYGLGNLTIEADDTIALGVDPTDSDSKWKYGSYGSAGDVSADGTLILTAGDDIYAHGKLSTTSGGNITANADDDIKLFNEPTSADADGTLTLIANSDSVGGGDLDVDGDLYGNMYLSGVDVTVDGTVTSFGTLDVDADDDIRLKKNVVSDGDMTMDAGDNITLNQNGGDTISHGDKMELKAGGNVTAYNNLTTTGDNGVGNMLVEGENIYVGGNADSDGTMTMTAIGDDEFLVASGSMNGSIKIEGYAKSKYDMEMTATGGNKSLVLLDFSNEVMNGSIAIGEYAKSRRGSMTMSANGGDVLETVTLIGPGTVLMNGSISIGDYAESKYDMLMTATGGSEGFDIILPDALDFDGMNGSIKIGDDAKSTRGSLTMIAEGGSEYLTYDETDIDLMNGSIKIGDDVTALCDLSLTATGGHELLTVDGLDVDGMNGSILIGDDAKSYLGNVTMSAEGGSEILTKDCLDITGMSGSIKIGGDVTSLFHLNLSAKGGSEIGTVDKYDIDGMNGSIWIEGNAKSYLDGVTMTAEGGSEILTYDEWDVDGMNGSIKIGGDVTSTSNMNLSAKGGSDILTADKFDIDGMNGSIEIGDDAKSLLGSVTMTAEGGSEFLAADCVDIDGMNGSIKIGDDVTAMCNLTLSAKGGSEIGTLDKFDIDMMNGSIKIGGDAESYFGGVTMTAEGGKEILSADLVDFDLMNGSIKIGGHVKSKYDLELTAKGGYEFLTVDGLDFDLMNGSIYVGDYVRSRNGAVTLTAEGTSEILTLDGLDIDLMNGSIFVGGYIESQDDTIISAQGGDEIWAGNHHDFSLLSGDVVVLGDIQSYGGNVEIYSSDDTTYLGGDVTAYDSVLLNNNTRFIGYGDQRVTAETGTLTANGWLDKRPFSLGCYGPTDGSLYLQANGDISLADYVTAACCCPVTCASRGGGVSIISETGKIFTPGYGDTLNVAITGRSDQFGGCGGIGVDLPYGPGKAAILIMSAEDLKLGTGAELRACGTYYSDGTVDDRYGINFLDYDGSFPPGPVPPAIPRDQGDPFDLAIYVASTTGDVDVSAPVSIMSAEWVEDGLPNGQNGQAFVTNDSRPNGGHWECESKGAMVIDAWNAVTFDGGVPGGLFEASLEAGDVGDHLEVCSRVSEWLQDAVGRLPYAMSAAAKSILWYGNPDSYVLRGAGADNPDIGPDAPAWVLELFEGPATPFPDLQLPMISGCPAETQAAASELGITAETIQVSIANALAVNPDIHPCQACARLIDAARILRDEDGSVMAATIQAFNALAPADAPFTPEMGASIAMTFEAAAAGTQYASVEGYIDAFVEYVTVLETGLGAPVGDSTVFAMEKYGAGIAENANIVAYIEARLAGL